MKDRARAVGAPARVSKRAKSRGAALVEAAVILPTLVFFIGATVFVYRAYAVKMDKQMGTRAGALSYAVHNCEGSVPEDMVPELDYADPYNMGNPASQLVDKFGSASPALRAGLQRGFSMVRARPPASTVSAAAARDGRRVILSRKVSAASVMACNEKAFGTGPKAVAEHMAAFATSGGGLL